MFETEFLKLQSVKPWIWLRYIDDVFFCLVRWRGQTPAIYVEAQWVSSQSQIYTYEYSHNRVNFLDVVVENACGNFITSLFSKPTDCHQYLHYDSSHPAHVKRYMVYSQDIRFKEICSRVEDADKHLQELSCWLQKEPTQCGLLGKNLRGYNLW
jgi:hypothetical protein